MEVRKEDKRRCGVYLIRNTINGKVYIGASIDIRARMYAHIGALRAKRRKSENDHFINSWHKHGEAAFVYIVLEECVSTELKEKEFIWTTKYESTNPLKGFNKRTDTKGGMITHEETSIKLRASMQKRIDTPGYRDMVGKRTSDFWRDNPDKKDTMALNVKKSKQAMWRFLKMDEEGNILQTYETVEDIIKENPSYKWQNIYSVCNGYKKRIYGYKWRKELKE